MKIPVREVDGEIHIKLPTVTCSSCGKVERVEVYGIGRRGHGNGIDDPWEVTGHMSYPSHWRRISWENDAEERLLMVCPACRADVFNALERLYLEVTRAR